MLKVIANRKSTRKFLKNTTITDEQILQMIESARLAPSGNNTQPWNFLIIKNEETKSALAKADGNQMWMVDAPVFIACVADIRSRIKDNTQIIVNEENNLLELKQIIRDTAIATEHLILTAEYLGFDTCWTAEYNQDDIRPILGIPQDKYVVAIVPIGKSAANNNAAPKRPLEEIIRYEKW